MRKVLLRTAVIAAGFATGVAAKYSPAVVRSLTGACLLNPGGDAYPHAPSLWLVGRCGKPCVIVIFDVTTGVARVRQMVDFAALRERWGEHVAFDQDGRAAVSRLLH